MFWVYVPDRFYSETLHLSDSPRHRRRKGNTDYPTVFSNTSSDDSPVVLGSAMTAAITVVVSLGGAGVGGVAQSTARGRHAERRRCQGREWSGRGRARGKWPRRYTATPPSPPTRAGQWRGVTRSPRVGAGADSHEFTRTLAFVGDDGGPE